MVCHGCLGLNLFRSALLCRPEISEWSDLQLDLVVGKDVRRSRMIAQVIMFLPFWAGGLRIAKVIVERVTTVAPGEVVSFELRNGINRFDLWSKALNFPALLWIDHADGLTCFKANRNTWTCNLPVHGDSCYRPIRLDNTLERPNAVFTPIRRSTHAQVVAWRRLKHIRRIPGQYTMSEVARSRAFTIAQPSYL